MDSETRRIRIQLLEEVGLAAAGGYLLDLDAIATTRGLDESTARMELDQLQYLGLWLAGEDGDPPMLLTAGSQFLALRGDVDDDDLRFLPEVVDDLRARGALRAAGTKLVDEFRAAILQGAAREHAADLVPPAFRAAVGQRLALDLFAATVALVSRLSAGAPAGCVAEEIVSVTLISDAVAWLKARMDVGEITEAAYTAAVEELQGCLYEFYGDDDVLTLFEMAEPADAAVAGHDTVNQQLGVVDQRIEAWFHAFGGTAETGHIHAQPDRPSDDDDREVDIS
jgi:hypothetical protein